MKEGTEAAIGVAVLAVVFFGGGAVGIALAGLLLPGSDLAQFLSFFMLPLSLLLGLQAWLGLALVIAIARLLFRLVSGRGLPGRDEVATEAPSGAFVFVPIAAALSGAVGAVCAFLPSSRGILLVLVAYLGTGAAYGTVLWLLARSRRLPLPDA